MILDVTIQCEHCPNVVKAPIDLSRKSRYFMARCKRPCGWSYWIAPRRKAGEIRIYAVAPWGMYKPPGKPEAIASESKAKKKTREKAERYEREIASRQRSG